MSLMLVGFLNNNHTSNISQVIQTQYVTSQSMNRKVSYSGHEVTPQEKDLAYVFGEQVVRPLLEWVPKASRNLFSVVHKSFNSFLSLPGVEGKIVPPNALEAIIESLGGVGSLKLTNDMVTKIIEDKQGDEQVDLDPEFVKKIKNAFAKFIEIVGVVVDPSEFTNFLVDEAENIALRKLAEIQRVANSQPMLNKPKSEKEIQIQTYRNNMQAYASLFKMHSEIVDKTLERMQQMGPELNALDDRIEEMQNLAHDILDKVKEYGEKFLDLDALKKIMAVKISVGEDLQVSLNNGIGNANYVINRYTEVFGDLTDETINSMSYEDQEVITYWILKRNEQTAILQYVNAQLQIDREVLNNYSSGSTNISKIIDTLHQQLKDVKNKYDEYKQMKKNLLNEMPIVIEKNQKSIEESIASKEKFFKNKNLIDTLLKDEL